MQKISNLEKMLNSLGNETSSMSNIDFEKDHRNVDDHTDHHKMIKSIINKNYSVEFTSFQRNFYKYDFLVLFCSLDSPDSSLNSFK